MTLKFLKNTFVQADGSCSKVFLRIFIIYFVQAPKSYEGAAMSYSVLRYLAYTVKYDARAVRILLGITHTCDARQYKDGVKS